jgi:hypothetical protein
MSGSSRRITPAQGNFLPDKEFRYLRHFVTPAASVRGGHDISAWLCMSPCRSDCIFTVERTGLGVQSLRIPHSRFPADCPHRTDCHCPTNGRVPPDTRSFQHTAKFCNGLKVDRYSYGRRLPGLRFRASPLRTNPSP